MVKYNLCQNSTTRRSIQCIKMNQRNKKEVQKVATSTEQETSKIRNQLLKSLGNVHLIIQTGNHAKKLYIAKIIKDCFLESSIPKIRV